MGLAQGRVGEVVRWTDGEREKFFSYSFDTIDCPSEGLVRGWSSSFDRGCYEGRSFFFTISGKNPAHHHLFRTLAENCDFFQFLVHKKIPRPQVT